MKPDLPCERIRTIREERGCRQDEIAAVLHAAQNTYSQYETGTIELTASHLVALAGFYRVSADYLLDRTAIQTPYPNK